MRRRTDEECALDPKRDDREHGVTLVEVMVALTLFAIVAAFGVGSLRNWQLAEAHRGAAVSLQTLLRQTQVRAVTEGVNFCVTFDTSAHTYTVHRYECGGPDMEEVAGPYQLGDPRLQLTSPAFKTATGTTGTSLNFRPTGSAWPGTVTVSRPESDKTYLLRVEGLTGRVSLS